MTDIDLYFCVKQVTYLLELSKAASSILFHILDTPTSELILGTSLSVLGSCQLQDLQLNSNLYQLNTFYYSYVGCPKTIHLIDELKI